MKVWIVHVCVLLTVQMHMQPCLNETLKQMKNNPQEYCMLYIGVKITISTKKLSEIAVCLYPLSEVNISVIEICSGS